MFESAYIAEFDKFASHDVDDAQVTTSKKPGLALGMPLAVMHGKQGAGADIVNTGSAIFGNAWPGRVVACI